jgi:hypothetical protein
MFTKYIKKTHRQIFSIQTQTAILNQKKGTKQTHKHVVFNGENNLQGLAITTIHL